MIMYQNADGSWTVRPDDMSGTGPQLITPPNTDSNNAYQLGLAFIQNWQQVVAVGPTGLSTIAATLTVTGATGVTLG